MAATERGHTEAIKLLLTAPDINGVNYVNVSLYLLTLSCPYLHVALLIPHYI